MKRDGAPNRRPGAETAAEAAELRKHLGRRGLENCGRTTEELRKLSSSLPPSLPPSDAASPCPAPSLVRTDGPAKPREGFPAAPPLSGNGRPAPDAGPYVAGRYGFTRNWCVMQGRELVAVVVYRKGAAELVRRLNAAHGAGVAG